MHKVCCYARSWSSDRMSQCNGSTIDIQLLHVQFQFLLTGQSLSTKCFINLQGDISHTSLLLYHVQIINTSQPHRLQHSSQFTNWQTPFTISLYHHCCSQSPNTVVQNNKYINEHDTLTCMWVQALVVAMHVGLNWLVLCAQHDR